MNSRDYLIIGQGIAGSVLALQLMRAGKKVLVIDLPDYSSSSKIAAGIWNPVVFKRLTKSWMADELIPVLNDFYGNAEQLLQEKFIYPRKIAKLFAEEQEEVLWMKKASGEMQNYLRAEIMTMEQPLKSNYSTVTSAGNLATKTFLNSIRNFLIRNHHYAEELFDYKLLQLDDNQVKYKAFTASKLIFCEGYRMQENPFFKWIPMKPAKGDVLTIFCENLKLDTIINKGVFILPLGNHLFRVGATYNWNELSDTPSESAKQELLEKLTKLIPYPYRVIEHDSGVRPSVIDRRPVMGTHPDHHQLAVFNGFGTKAVMLAPYFAKHFSDVLDAKCELLREVDVKRFSARLT